MHAEAHDDLIGRALLQGNGRDGRRDIGRDHDDIVRVLENIRDVGYRLTARGGQPDVAGVVAHRLGGIDHEIGRGADLRAQGGRGVYLR